MKLRPKQEKFCNLYIETSNASEAYRKVYSCKGSSDKTIWEAASKLVSKLSPRIQELQSELRKKSNITKDRVLEELRCIAFADIRDFLSIRNGMVIFKDSSEWTEEMARAVESVKVTKEGIELKLNGKSWSISRICKMLGYDEPTEVNIKQMLLDIDTGTGD